MACADGRAADSPTEPTHLTRMGAESDGAEATAIVHTIRDKIVEYKELLLRQLVDQRVALLAIDNAAHEKETKEAVSEGMKAVVPADVVMNGPSKARREAEEAAADTSSQTRTELPRKRIRSVSNVGELRSIKMVQRTSTPPRRYLEHKERDEGQQHGNEQEALVLRSPSRSHLTTPTGRTPPRAHARSRSIDEIHADFEHKLRVTMRLHQDVNRRTVAMTRKRQLPRLSTPDRVKSQWDYLLEEMRWMAMDFSQERNWKRVMQFHLAKDVVTALNADKVRREQENRQLARGIALQVSAFWRTIERIAARSRVRFESGSGGSADDDSSSRTTQDKAEEAVEASVSDASSGEALRFRTVRIANDSDEDDTVTQVNAVKKRVEDMVLAGKRARALLNESVDHQELHPRRESAFQRLSSRSMSMLTAFQVFALRWMMELCLSGCNCLLNDQIGMGKAATVAAFLRVLDLYEPPQQSLEISRPHLIVVPSDELHKWSYFIREWNPDAEVQIYHGSTGHRKRLQRDWTKKLNVVPFLRSEEVEDLDDDDNRPVYCCVASVTAFLEDIEAFQSHDNWQMFIVEVSELEASEWEESVQHLHQIRQKQRRVVCSDQPVESWSSRLRWGLAEFLVRDSDEAWNSDVWMKHVVLEKSSATDMAKLFGKTASSLLKVQSDHVSALVLALYCLGLRRVRSEVEAQLGKLEEQSVACSLTTSQLTQYRNAVSGFALSSKNGREDRIDAWLELFLRLRGICNCVDLLNDADKLALADLAFLLSSSGKLQELVELLDRLVTKESRRVVVYCQLDALFPIIEMLLALKEFSFVRITGSVDSQQRALCHFALRPTVQIALASTRLAAWQGRRSVSVYGADAVIVMDSDWNATCDAKLRASWAQLTIGRDLLPVYRFHSDQTIESALLRVGSCLNDKVFGEMSLAEVIAASQATDAINKLEKPSWWSAQGDYSSPAKLGEVMASAEEKDKYCGSELETQLQVANVELDAEEHLLLANADELTPVEWYAVNYVHHVTEQKRQSNDQERREKDELNWRSVSSSKAGMFATSFEDLALSDSQQHWQEDLEPSTGLFYSADEVFSSAPVVTNSLSGETALENVFRDLRINGIETQYGIYHTPHAPLDGEVEYVNTDHESTDPMQMMFHVSYRMPAPPAPAPTTKPLGSETPVKTKMKKNRAGAGGLAGTPGSVGSLKRKHDANGNPIGKPAKEQRLDLEGIPLPDVAEFEDDDFWGDTNLDALDAGLWDDANVLSGLLGPSLDASSSAAGSTNTPGTSGTTKKKVKSSGGAGGSGASSSSGRARKGSISDSGRDGWNVQEDLVLKKLFEQYGSNWTLIAHVFNASTSVSRFVCRKRTPRQCYDRYGKIISGSLTTSSSGGSGVASATSTPTKEGKSSSGISLKQQKLNAAAAAIWTPEVLAERIGVPDHELVLVFAARDSLPGLPPPSIVNVPSLVEMSMKKKKLMQKQSTSADTGSSASASGLDDLKSIRTSFDAILQCMKRKTSPPPIPIPQPAGTNTSASTTSTPSATDLTSTTTGSTPKGSIVTPVPTVVPPPHKSHLDLVEMLPRLPLAPDEVIKRSKEVAAAAVQAAAAVASAGREVSPLAAAGDVMMGAAFGSAARKTPNATLSAGRSTLPHHASPKIPPTPGSGSAWGDTPSSTRSVTGPSHAASALATTPVNAAGVNGSADLSGTTPTSSPANGLASGRNPMPVTTSALLHVLDRMPEIKNKIQAILNRSDCSEAQKVAMIARLLSNTNAINATAVAAAASGNMTAAVSATLGAAAAAAVSASAANAGGAGFSAASRVSTTPTNASTDAPLPMPASLANDETASTTSSNGVATSTATSMSDLDAADLT
ncbi:hypothetical protein Poli38472_014740 [Pythium oligandrum]|uniref:Uncharacterized protein n=1 Tax=Pythium oligandrum TaxID=41045 RepID=A0A8K1C1Z5_PYTOL|nr:hypothetical protein Poli38472_014740 [Pythium oligandrum]|eukprot:TMW54969.1 hypothetical protein Poli38472_014740 [Pythium oligandrum]